MKDICIGILLVTTLVFGGLCLRQSSQEHKAAATIAELRQNVTTLEAQVKEEQHHANVFRDRLEEATADSEAKTAQLAQLQKTAVKTDVPADAAPATNTSKTESKTANAFGDMLQKPEVKEMVKAQQKMVFSGMVDKNYAGLFAQLGLTSEQASTLKDLVLKKFLVDSSMGVSLLGSDVDAAKRTEMVQQAKAEKDAINDQIHQFLGDDNYTQFQSYEKTQPDRMGVSMFKDQLASGPNALTPDQENQLVQVLGEERQSFKFTTDFSDQSKVGPDFASSLTEEKLNQWMQERGQLDERYLARAQTILSPDQMTSFKTYLSSQDQMAVAGLKLAGQMFAPKKVQN
jgi:hypothetical protein